MASRPTGKRRFPLSRVYRLLEPGPVLLVTTAHRGRPNVMTLAWHTPMEFEPPLVGLVLSDRNFSFVALRATGECVLNIPTADLARQVVGCGNVSGRRVDKFARFGLTASPASRVAPPLVAECYASLECRVADSRFVAKYAFFVVEVLAAWVDRSRLPARTLHHRGSGEFAVATQTLKLPSRKA